jgi:hypothetical protein
MKEQLVNTQCSIGPGGAIGCSAGPPDCGGDGCMLLPNNVCVLVDTIFKADFLQQKFFTPFVEIDISVSNCNSQDPFFNFSFPAYDAAGNGPLDFSLNSPDISIDTCSPQDGTATLSGSGILDISTNGKPISLPVDFVLEVGGGTELTVSKDGSEFLKVTTSLGVNVDDCNNV